MEPAIKKVVGIFLFYDWLHQVASGQLYLQKRDAECLGYRIIQNYYQHQIGNQTTLFSLIIKCNTFVILNTKKKKKVLLIDKNFTGPIFSSPLISSSHPLINILRSSESPIVSPKMREARVHEPSTCPWLTKKWKWAYLKDLILVFSRYTVWQSAGFSPWIWFRYDWSCFSLSWYLEVQFQPGLSLNLLVSIAGPL